MSEYSNDEQAPFNWLDKVAAWVVYSAIFTVTIIMARVFVLMWLGVEG